MLTACFDASGHKTGQDFLTVAGFVSSANCWVEFENEWKKCLCDYNIPFFRMVEFAHSKGPFKSWKDNETVRREFLRALMKIIKRNVFRKFGCTVRIDDLNSTIRPESRDLHLLEGYVIAARTCVKDVRDWMRWEHINTSVEFVFEEGDLDQGKLFERFVADGLPTPIFKPKKDTEKSGFKVPGFVPLQAADMLAYELFLIGKREEPEEKWRWAAREFMHMEGRVGVYRLNELRRMQLRIDEMK